MKRKAARKRPRFALRPLTITLKTTPCLPPTRCVTPTCCAVAAISLGRCFGASLEFAVNPGKAVKLRALVRDLKAVLKKHKLGNAGVKLKAARKKGR